MDKRRYFTRVLLIAVTVSLVAVALHLRTWLKSSLSSNMKRSAHRVVRRLPCISR